VADKLTSLFIHLWRNKRLGPLYIIRPPLLETNVSLLTWSQTLQEQILEEHFKVSKQRAKEKREQGHPDILNIYKDQADKNYKVDNTGIEELFRMQMHSATEINHRFIFIHEGEKIKEALANKLLKVLEDLRSDMTILILNNSQKQMLKTIESRAIKLSMFLDETQKNSQQNENVTLNQALENYLKNDYQELLENIQNCSISKALDNLQQKNNGKEKLILALTSFAQSNKSPAHFKVKYLNQVKIDNRQAIYNGHPGARNYNWLMLCFNNE